MLVAKRKKSRGFKKAYRGFLASYTFGMEIEMLVPDLLVQTQSSGLMRCSGSWRCCLGMVGVLVYGSVSPLGKSVTHFLHTLVIMLSLFFQSLLETVWRA